MAREIVESGAASSYEDLLDQVAAIPGRKLFNALLAILQMPHATMLCTAADWQRKWGRRVTPEQRPLVLLYPFGPVEFVFDVTQTEPTNRARPLPINAAPFGMDPFVHATALVARLMDSLVVSGVRVVRARQGVALAGKIRRTEDAGAMVLPSTKIGETDRHVQVRWVVALNDSHPPTEQLATLTHELGHLFCGHVGADQGDPWPSRDVPDIRTREFEAESVARLVFRRIAPGVELPPYLEQILKPDEPLPDHGWTAVTQAADAVLELLRIAPTAATPPALLEEPRGGVPPPSWTQDVDIRPGGASAIEVVLISDADGRLAEPPSRLVATWSSVTTAAERPWIAVARSSAAVEGVLAYFDHAPGEDPDHDLYMRQVESILPLGELWLTVVRAGDSEQEELVALEVDPPNHGDSLTRVCVERLNEQGISTTEVELNTGWMYAWHPSHDDLGASEQVLDWDDVYSDEHWRFLSECERLFVGIRPSPDLLQNARLLEVLATTIASTRRAVNYYDQETT